MIVKTTNPSNNRKLLYQSWVDWLIELVDWLSWLNDWVGWLIDWVGWLIELIDWLSWSHIWESVGAISVLVQTHMISGIWWTCGLYVGWSDDFHTFFLSKEMLCKHVSRFVGYSFWYFKVTVPRLFIFHSHLIFITFNHFVRNIMHVHHVNW